MSVDAWIPAVGENGRVTERSLSGALLEAHGITGLTFPAPTLLPAVLRQALIPLVIDAIGLPRSPKEWGERFSRGRFSDSESAAIDEYITQHRDAFELFDSARPFGQVGDLAASSGETKSVSLMLPFVASGNNVPFFSYATDGDRVEVSPPEAAWWLMNAHCWDTAAIKTGAAGDPATLDAKGKATGKTTGNPVGSLGRLGVIVPIGRTLYETLLLNLPLNEGRSATEDRPQWRADKREIAWPGGPAWSTRAPRGVCDLLTWQSRRMRLFPEAKDGGVVVSRVLVCAGDRMLRTPEYEPHTAWRKNPKPKKGEPAARPRQHRPGQDFWQSIPALIALSESESGEVETSLLLRQLSRLRTNLGDAYPLRLQSCGVVYGNQSAVVEDVVSDELPLPLASLVEDSRTRAQVLDVVAQADALIRAVDRLNGNLLQAQGAEKPPWDKGDHPGDTLRHALDPVVRHVLRGIALAQDDAGTLDDRRAAWERAAWSIAHEHGERVLARYGPRAFIGRTVKTPGNSELPVNSTAAWNWFRRSIKDTLVWEDERRIEERDANAEDEAHING